MILQPQDNGHGNKGFCGKFDGEKWTVGWTNRLLLLKNRVNIYESSMQNEERVAFEKEVD